MSLYPFLCTQLFSYQLLILTDTFLLEDVLIFFYNILFLLLQYFLVTKLPFHYILLIEFHQTELMINIFNMNSILIYRVCHVIFNCPFGDEIVTKEILLSEKISFNFALLLLLTCGINILFFIFLGILTDLFSTIFISSYYISDVV